jgi:hypothetical protein
MNVSLCTAMTDGLGTNATLEHLEVEQVLLYDDNFITPQKQDFQVLEVRHALWC